MTILDVLNCCIMFRVRFYLHVVCLLIFNVYWGSAQIWYPLKMVENKKHPIKHHKLVRHFCFHFSPWTVDQYFFSGMDPTLGLSIFSIKSDKSLAYLRIISTFISSVMREPNDFWTNLHQSITHSQLKVKVVRVTWRTGSRFVCQSESKNESWNFHSGFPQIITPKTATRNTKIRKTF